jgi:hypothetical protein
MPGNSGLLPFTPREKHSKENPRLNPPASAAAGETASAAAADDCGAHAAWAPSLNEMLALLVLVRQRLAAAVMGGGFDGTVAIDGVEQ